MQDDGNPKKTVPDRQRHEHHVDRRGVLKGISAAAALVTTVTAASDTALAAGNGYGQGGYGATPYGGAGFSVAAQAATDQTATSVTLSGELTNLDSFTSATCYFQWRQSGATDWNTTMGQTLSATGRFDANVTGLSAGTTYEYRAVSDAADGQTATGTAMTVTTREARPTVTTAQPSGVTTSTVTLNGSLDSLGGASSVECYLQWREAGTTSWTTTVSQSFSSTGVLSTDLTGLSGNTDYEYRIAARTGDGLKVTGTTVVFSTTAPNTSPTIDSFSVSEAGKPDPHLKIVANWSVSDADGDLDTAVVEVRDSTNTLLDAALTEVTGSAATLSNNINIKEQDDETVEVTVTVVDTLGNSTSQSTSVTE